jgi:hypothetical protein
MCHFILPMLVVLGAAPAESKLPVPPPKEPTAITKYLSKIELPSEWQRRWDEKLALMKIASLQREAIIQINQNKIEAWEWWGWLYTPEFLPIPPLPPPSLKSTCATQALLIVLD